VVEAQVALDVGEDLLELRALDRRRVGDRIADVLLHACAGVFHASPRAA
jgi:hypothetical protein